MVDIFLKAGITNTILCAGDVRRLSACNFCLTNIPDHDSIDSIEYLISYYGRKNTSWTERGVYYYWNGEVAVKQRGWVEIKAFEQLVNRIL